MEQESPGSEIFRCDGHPVLLCRRAVGKHGIRKPHVPFSHNGNGIQTGIRRKGTQVKFAFPQEVPGKNMELIGKLR
jgi:hypothetical protein